ncbi:DUF4118 domain-containing protein [Streptomyces sp. NBC_01262]|uniref:DUF4118 domain-containing protein n=1 Tax=Streptomyces sp. NBC_01262 TaxID=2903803 RepID=UPI002E31B6C4|nr:DUF4118 domain-containing protein [Streptomyces sp. NBC_01262]
MVRRITRDGIAMVAALAVPLAVTSLLVPLRSHFSNTNAALVLVVAVVAVAAFGNRLAGAIAALSAAIWFDFFLTLPYERFTITRSADVTTAVLLLVVGLAVSQLAVRARRLEVIAITDAGYLAQIHDTAELVQSAANPHAVVEQVRGQLSSLLQLRGCRFEYGTLMGHPPRLEQDGTVLSGRTRWDVDRLGLPAEEVELRAYANGRFCGRFMMDPVPGTVPSLQARLVAVTLANQAGAALNTTRPAIDSA